MGGLEAELTIVLRPEPEHQMIQDDGHWPGGGMWVDQGSIGKILSHSRRVTKARPTTMSDTEDNSPPPSLMTSDTSPIIQKK